MIKQAARLQDLQDLTIAPLVPATFLIYGRQRGHRHHLISARVLRCNVRSRLVNCTRRRAIIGRGQRPERPERPKVDWTRALALPERSATRRGGLPAGSTATSQSGMLVR